MPVSKTKIKQSKKQKKGHFDCLICNIVDPPAISSDIETARATNGLRTYCNGLSMSPCVRVGLHETTSSKLRECVVLFQLPRSGDKTTHSRSFIMISHVTGVTSRWHTSLFLVTSVDRIFHLVTFSCKKIYK